MDTCYFGVVGSETENGVCRDSILNLKTRPGDAGFMSIRATKGYEARQMHINNWKASDHDWIFLMDSDMVFPSDALEKLRERGKPFISGFYMRRRYDPIAPVWYESAHAGKWPLMPWTKPLEENTLYEIGASGWGCMLMHKDVLSDTEKLLKGEPAILEDDMDVWPYDLREVLAGREQLRVLRGVRDCVGSDIRFAWFAKIAGHQLWGDTGVACGHMTNYPVQLMDWTNCPPSYFEILTKNTIEDQERERARIQKGIESVTA